MKKIIILLISCTAIISCSSNDETPAVAASSFKFILTDNTAEMNEVYSQEFTLDSDGKVLTETYTDYLYPQFSSVSIFKYDNQGRIIKEIRNNELYNSVVWNGNIASLYNYQSNINASFTFSNDKLIEYSYGNGDIFKFNYDSNDNVISEEKENIIYVEYLDYDTTISNPMNLIKSIGILRLSSNPYMKNFYETKKAYPYVDEDFSYPLTYYHYQKTVNADNKIITTTNDENYYIHKFEYN